MYIDSLAERKKANDRKKTGSQLALERARAMIDSAKSTQTGQGAQTKSMAFMESMNGGRSSIVPEELSPVTRLKGAADLSTQKQYIPVSSASEKKPVTSVMDADYYDTWKRERDRATEVTVGGKSVLPTAKDREPETRDRAENIAYNVGAWLAPENADSGNFLNNLRYPIARLVAGALGFGEGITDFAGAAVNDVLSEGAHMLGLHSVGDWFSEGSDYTRENNMTAAFNQGIADKSGEVSKLQGIAGDIYEGAGQLIPNILTGKALGGAANLAGDKVSKALVGLSSAGNATQEAYDESADKNQATAYGAASGLLEVAIESIAGGIPGLGEGVTGKLMDKLKNSPATLKLLADVLGEGGEEALSTYLTPALKKMTYDPNAENATAEEIIRSAAMGSALSAITQSGNLPASIAEDIFTLRSRGQNTKAASAGAEADVSSDVDLKGSDDVAQVYRLAGETQRQLDGLLSDVADRLGIKFEAAGQKSMQSMSDKVQRKSKNGVQYSVYDMKDHARGKLELSSFEQIPEVLSLLDEKNIPWSAEAVGPTEWGYRGFHVTFRDGNGISSEIQLTRPDVWRVKLESDKIYEKWRNVDYYGLSAEQSTDYLKDLMRSKEMWNGLDLPEFTAWASSPSVKTSPSIMSPKRIEDFTGTHEPRSNSNIPVSVVSNIRPDSVMQAMESPLSQSNSSIAQNNEKSNSNLPRNIGAKEAEFGYTEKVNQQNSTQSALTEQERQMQGLRPEDHAHRVVTDAEARAKASERLDFDFEGEMESLRDMSDWDKDDTTAAHLILRELIEQARDSGDYSRAVEWNNTLTAHQSAQGQALQANRQFVNSPETIIAEAAEVLEGEHMRPMSEKKKADVLKKVGELADSMEALKAGEPAETAAGYIDIIRQAAKQRRTGSLFTNKLSKTMNWALEGIKAQGDLDYLENLAASSIRAIATDYKKTSIVEGVKTFRRNAMLSKASTIMRNLVANNVFDPVDSISNNVAVPLDMLLSKFTKTRSVAVDKSWLSGAKRQGSMEGLMRSIVEVGLDIDGEGRSKYEMDINRGGRTFKMSGGAFSKLMSTWTKWEGYALQSTDEIQKGGIRAESQRGIDQLYDRGLITDDSLRDAGQQEALYRTFQDDTAISRAVLGVRKGLNSIAIKDSQGGSFGLGDAAIPFAQVPSNLGARAIEYSPVGLVKSTAELVNVLKKAHDGTLTAAEQAKAVKGIGRGLNGSALIAAFAWLTSEGLIHVLGVGDDEDEDAFAMAKSEGLSGTQFNLDAAMRRFSGGDTAWQDGDSLMSIDFLEPLNALMTIGALIAEDREIEGLSLKNIAKNSLSGAGQSILDLPMMGKFQDIYDSFRYSDGKNDGMKVVDAALTALAADIASFVPNALKGIAQGTDDTVRDTYGGDGLFARTVDSLKAGIPWLRQTIPAKLDGFGQERKSEENPLLNALNNNLLPGRINTYRHGEVSAELERISEQAGTSKAYPDRKPPNSITYDSEKYDLTSEQKRTYQERAGQLTYEIYQGMMSGKGYRDLTTEKKLEALSNAKGYAREFAKQEVLKELGVYAEPPSAYGKAFEAIDRGVDEAQYFVYNASRNRFDFDGSGQLNAKEFAASLKKSRMPASSQSAMWAVYYPDWPDKAKEAGVAFDVYTQYRANVYGVESDKDEAGNSISGSKKEKVLNIIDGMDISDEDKDRLYLSAGYSEKTLGQVPWRRR